MSECELEAALVTHHVCPPFFPLMCAGTVVNHVGFLPQDGNRVTLTKLVKTKEIMESLDDAPPFPCKWTQRKVVTAAVTSRAANKQKERGYGLITLPVARGPDRIARGGDTVGVRRGFSPIAKAATGRPDRL